MTTLSVTLEGIEHGTLSFDGQMVTLVRKRRELRIPARSIVSISIDKLGIGIMGIRFGTSGGATTTGYTGGMIQAADANVFNFRPKHEAAFRDVAALIEAAAQPEPERSATQGASPNTCSRW